MMKTMMNGNNKPKVLLFIDVSDYSTAPIRGLFAATHSPFDTGNEE
jgi:hypothetical protein